MALTWRNLTNRLGSETNSRPRPPAHIRRLQPYSPVSSLDQIAQAQENTPYKLDWNEATIEPSPKVNEAVMAFLTESPTLRWYPDLRASNLRESLEEYTGVSRDSIIVTNGSDDALLLLCRTFLSSQSEVVVPIPTYNHFFVYAGAQNARIVEVVEPDPFRKNIKHLGRSISAMTRNNLSSVSFSLSSEDRLSNIKKDITIEDLNKQIIQTLDNSLEKEISKINKSIPCIFSGHLTVMEAKTSTETLMSIGADYMFPAQFFARPEFEYVALGHVHKDQVLIKSPPVIYSGSLERVDFGEKNDIKGFYVIEIEPKKSQGSRLVSYKKVPVSARNFREYIINIPKETEFPVNIIEEELKSNDIKDSIARITIESTREHYESINDPKIQSILSNAKYLVSTELKLISEKKINDLQITENLGIIDSFEKYLENFKEINDQKRKRLLDFGKEIINEYENENE